MAASIGPDSPPMTNRTMKPSTNSIGVFRMGLPAHRVASQANTCTALGMVMSMLAAEKKLIDTFGSPTANMWWTHTPNPTMATAMVASARKT